MLTVWRIPESNGKKKIIIIIEEKAEVQLLE